MLTCSFDTDLTNNRALARAIFVWLACFTHQFIMEKDIVNFFASAFWCTHMLYALFAMFRSSAFVIIWARSAALCILFFLAFAILARRAVSCAILVWSAFFSALSGVCQILCIWTKAIPWNRSRSTDRASWIFAVWITPATSATLRWGKSWRNAQENSK